VVKKKPITELNLIIPVEPITFSLRETIKEELVLENKFIVEVENNESVEESVSRCYSTRMMADSGASGVYIAQGDSDRINWSGISSQGHVRVASGQPLELGRKGTIAIQVESSLRKKIPELELECTEVQGIAESVIGVRAILKALPTAQVVFTNNEVKVVNEEVVIARGERLRDGMWYLTTEEVHDKVNSVQAFLPRVHLESTRDKVAYLHAMTGFAPVSTLCRAVRKGWISLLGITETDIVKNPPKSFCTARGYTKLSTSGWHSTDNTSKEKQIRELSQEHPATELESDEKVNALYTFEMDTRDTIHSDAMGDVTGSFISARGILRVHVTLHPGSNFILLKGMKLGEATVFAVEAAITRLEDVGERVTEIVIDNVAGITMKAYLNKHGKIINICPPYVHRMNKAEAAIDHVKSVIIAMLAGTDIDFKREDWDLVLYQAEDLINLMREGREGKSAYETFYKRKYQWEEHPMGIFGCAVEAWVPKKMRTTLQAKTKRAFYICAAKDHYRCVKILVPGDRELLVSDNIVWYPSVVKIPGITRLAEITEALDLFNKNVNENKLLGENTKRQTQMKHLIAIVKNNLRMREEGISENDEEEEDGDERGPVSVSESTVYFRINKPSEAVEELDNEASEGEIEVEMGDNQNSEGEVRESINTNEDAKRTKNKKSNSRRKSKESKSKEAVNHYEKQYKPRQRLNMITEMSAEEINEQMLYQIVTTEGKLTYDKAIKTDKKLVWESKLEAELDRLIENTKTGTPIRWKDKEVNKKAAYASLVLEHKPGKDERIRIVYGGNTQEENPLWTSRNTDMVAKKLFLNKIVSEGLKFMTLDIKDFYLSEMNTLDSPEYMVLKEKYLPKKYKEKYQALISNGQLLIRLDKTIYGMKQAGYISQRNLIEILTKNGYKEENYNSIFTNTDKSISFATHVDDFGVGYKDKEKVLQLIKVLKDAGYTITEDWEGKKFCGLEIELNQGKWIDISVRKTIERTVTRFGKFKERDCPYKISAVKFCKEQLEAEIDSSPELSEEEKTLLQEKVGLTRYIATAAYPHLELAVGKIAASLSKPTRDLMEQANHMLGYLQSHPDRVIRYYPSDMIMRAHSDASYGCEADFRCRTGGFIYMGNGDKDFVNGPIEVLSLVQKNNVTCTAEAEYVAVFDVAQRLAYLRKLAESLGYPQGTIIIECDNECAVKLSNNNSHERKLRHVAMRYHWVKDQVRQGLIDVIWRKNVYNLADFATKRMRTLADYIKGRDAYTVEAGSNEIKRKRCENIV